MYTIFLTTFREIIRGRFWWLMGFFAVIEIFGLVFFQIISLEQAEFVVVDFGLSFIEIMGVLLILFLWNRLLSREFEEKTIYLTLSRPVSRGAIILGKFFGFSLVMVIFVAILSSILMGIMAFFGVSLTTIFFWAIVGIFAKLVILTAIILFFSIFLSGILATFSTLAVYIIAHSGYALLEYAINSENTVLLTMGQAIVFVFPNFQALNLKNMVHLTNLPSASHFFWVFAFSFVYLTIILFLSQYIFSKKSFDNI